MLKAKSRKAKDELDEAALSQRAEDSSKAFERQQHAQADQIRKQECHEMEKERQKWTTLLAEAKLYSQQPVTTRREIMTEALTSKLPTPNS